MNDQDLKPRTITKVETQRPRLHKVILVNDDYTPREFVVRVPKGEFRMSEEFRIRLAEVKKMAQGPARDAAEIKLEADLASARQQRSEGLGNPKEPKLRKLVKDPENPADREADAALEILYQKEYGERHITELVRIARNKGAKWQGHYVRRVLESGRGRRS